MVEYIILKKIILFIQLYIINIYNKFNKQRGNKYRNKKIKFDEIKIIYYFLKY